MPLKKFLIVVLFPINVPHDAPHNLLLGENTIVVFLGKVLNSITHT